MASAYLTKSISTTGSQTKGTLSVWLKKSDNTNEQAVLNHFTDSNNFLRLRFNASTMVINATAKVSGTNYYITTNAVFRDTSAWYHIVWKIDTTQATQSDRYKLYVNNNLQTFSASNLPTLNLNCTMNTSGQTIKIGASEATETSFFNGCMTHYHWTDGYAYDASDFGETDSTSGIWKPKTAPSVTYGTNGFFLKMENSGAMGTDSSGNSNTFTVNGTITQTEDTPSNNFATGNPIANGGGNLTFTNGNTTIYDTDSTWRSGFGGLAPSSGKWYFEVKRVGASSNVWIGIMDSSQLDGTGAYKFVAKSRGYGYSAGGEKGNNGTETGGWGDTYAQNDIIGVAMDLDNNKIYFSKNGTWQDSGDPTSGATGTGSMYDLASGYNYFPATSLYSTTAGVSFNFGNGYFGTTAVASSNSDGDGLGLFEYSVPSGYYALCTKNIKNYG